MEAQRRPDPAEGDHANAELRRGPYALRPVVPRWRCGAHRAADGRERAESRDGRRAAACDGARIVLRDGERRAASRILGARLAADLAGAAFLLVDDIDVAP